MSTFNSHFLGSILDWYDMQALYHVKTLYLNINNLASYWSDKSLVLTCEGHNNYYAHNPELTV